MDEFMVDYSSICNAWFVLRIPAWAIEMAGDDGYWTNDDGDSYTPYEMAMLVSEHKTKLAAMTAMKAAAHMATRMED